MAIWSSLRAIISRAPNNAIARRTMSDHRIFPLQPSRFQWNKFKDLLNFYILVGAIPAGLIIAYVNVFIGPATLTEIPKDYTPKHWEYYRSPITRFIARYILNSPQQEYEKYLHYIFEEDEKRKLTLLARDIQRKMAERGDYKAYYYRPVLGKYHRVSKEAADYLESIRGD